LLVGSDELTPDVFLRIADVTLVTQEDRAARDLSAPIEQRTAATERAALTSAQREHLLSSSNRAGQPQLIARVDPVRIGDLRVVAPDLRPSVGVLVIAVTQVPQRVTALNQMNVGHRTHRDLIVVVATQDRVRTLKLAARSATRARIGLVRDHHTARARSLDAFPRVGRGPDLSRAVVLGCD